MEIIVKYGQRAMTGLMGDYTVLWSDIFVLKHYKYKAKEFRNFGESLGEFRSREESKESHAREKLAAGARKNTKNIIPSGTVVD